MQNAADGARRETYLEGGGLPPLPLRKEGEGVRLVSQPACLLLMCEPCPCALGRWGPEAEGISSVQTSCLLPRILSLIKALEMSASLNK